MAHPARLWRRGARTPLFAALRRALDLAALANQPGAPPVEDLLERHWTGRPWSRREFLGTASAAIGLVPWVAAATAAGAAASKSTAAPPSAPVSSARKTAPRVVIVGAGLAGLDAAFRLREAGVTAAIYDAARRTGGRVFTTRDLVGPGLTTEMGGEFIDSDHAEMLDLVRILGLRTLDMRAAGEERFTDTYRFGATLHSEKEAILAFRPLVERMRRDAASLGTDFDSPQAENLDRLSLAEYLDRAGAFGWMRQLLEVAYVTEYGRDAQEQSCLNLVVLAATGTDATRFEIFGSSDERFKVEGGNQLITDGLARRLQGQLHLEHRLEAVRERGSGFTLTLAKRGGTRLDVDADLVILTLPFTLLRQVDLQVTLPEAKRRAIDELGYGNGAKLFLGFATRAWREQGRSGSAFSDEPYQSCWDHTRRQPGTPGGLTVFCGGQAGLDLGSGGADEHARRLLPGLDRTFPGLAVRGAERAEIYHWPSAPFARGSYACYAPGQWTGFAGVEGESVGNLLFAGEHCSRDYQGYMNGAAETGHRAAKEVLARVAGRSQRGR